MDAARSSIPTAGSLVGDRYRVGLSIGEGGMGVVLAARDEREGKDVALKLLQVVGEANIERFLREARLVTKLTSDHVVRVLDVGTFGAFPFIVMERLDGEDFGAKVRDTGALSLTAVADCVVQTCEALAHAHGTGIVHRDVKASNLFEHKRADGTRLVKVLDFGISKMFAQSNPREVERTLTRTRDGGFLGSPPYMSPEHVKDPRNVDGRADLWSLGVVAYRLLSTRFPFPGETTGEVLAHILESRPAKLRSLGVEIPEGVDAIIDRCLKRDREERFPDVGALAQAFAPYASKRFQSYAERVPQIVATSAIPSPAETTRSRKRVVEPSTQTVPPPPDDEAATMTFTDESARALLPVARTQKEEVRSPLEVHSTGSIALVSAPAEPPPRSKATLVALLALVMIGGVVGTVAVMRRASITPDLPAPSVSSVAPSVAPVASAIPSAVPEPAPPPVTAGVAPKTAPEPHAGRTKPTHISKPVAAPRPAPAPAPPPSVKKDLEDNPYKK